MDVAACFVKWAIVIATGVTILGVSLTIALFEAFMATVVPLILQMVRRFLSVLLAIVIAKLIEPLLAKLNEFFDAGPTFDNERFEKELLVQKEELEARLSGLKESQS